MSASPPVAPRQTYYLRRRLVALLIGVVALLWSVSAVVAFRTAHAEADELFDAQLVQVGETLLALVAAGAPGHVADEMAEHQHAYQLPVAFQAWRRHGSEWQLLVRSSEAPLTPLAANPGFDEHDLNGELWRFYTVDHTHSAYRVIVGQNHAARLHLAGEVALHLLLPILIGLPLIALGIWAVVGRAMRPLDEVARAVGGLDARRLAPVRVDGPLPEEIAPLVASIDALVGRVTEVMENERRFTADAAHELRTPLAALKIQAQVASRSTDDAGRRHALDAVLSGVERMNHLVEQLLTLARLDPEAGLPANEWLDLHPVAEGVCSVLTPLALRRQQSVSLEGDAPLQVRGNRWWLEVLLRNLVDNALRYGSDGGLVVLRIDSAARSLQVSDDGPGIPPSEREALLTRFARGPELDAEGCGLGLSIVARIALILGASLAFGDGIRRADGGCGLAVILHFPADDPPSIGTSAG